ncbi:RNA-directed DNA polymerase from mobile element jockey-like [Gigaspora margarita]|uniref:RNA-directed DNA polymerase from mobile element jockey-like n=1 Tax=Gigaspora margarita TaxID=4874 RepID=A0A8H3XC16_GIGMA|nr:RNA-directed DNA polymerase from mobile element jockey-like [Gigaspora margarita]
MMLWQRCKSEYKLLRQIDEKCYDNLIAKIKMEEIQARLSESGLKKATGLLNISNEMLRYLSKEVLGNIIETIELDKTNNPYRVYKETVYKNNNKMARGYTIKSQNIKPEQSRVITLYFDYDAD